MKLTKRFQKAVAVLHDLSVHEFNKMYNGQIMIDCSELSDRVYTANVETMVLDDFQGVADQVELVLS